MFRLTDAEQKSLAAQCASDNTPGGITVLRPAMPPTVALAVSMAVSEIATLQVFLWLTANDHLTWAQRRGHIDARLRVMRMTLADSMTGQMQPVVERDRE